MNPEYHLAISAALGLVFYFTTHSLLGAIMLFLVGFFIDLDHFIDFWIGKKKISLNIKEFFDFFYKHEYKKVYVLFHSIEFLPLLFLPMFFLDRIIVYGIVVGFASHMITDYLGNQVKFLSYFLLYRISIKFTKKNFCRTGADE